MSSTPAKKGFDLGGPSLGYRARFRSNRSLRPGLEMAVDPVNVNGTMGQRAKTRGDPGDFGKIADITEITEIR